MGAVVELIASRLLVSAVDLARLNRIPVAETARLATSAFFEFAIQDDPTEARRLFVDWFSPFVAVPEPVVWALDSFRSVDPYRAHAYAVGWRFAESLTDRLMAGFGEDPAAWGRWLREALWAPGRRDTFSELAQLAPDQKSGTVPRMDHHDRTG